MSTIANNNTLIAYESAKEVPETHTWTFPDDYPISSEPIPVIDLNNPNVLDHLHEACKTFGVFQLVGHGVPLDTLQRWENQVSQLFSLPMEQLKASQISGHGSAAMEKFYNASLWSGGITFVGSPVEQAQKLWPEDPMTFCNIMEEYKEEIKSLSCKLMRLMLQSLGFNDNDINSSNTVVGKPNELTEAVRVFYYPPCPQPDKVMGLGMHTDTCLITILYQSKADGLQVLMPDDGAKPAHWVPIPVVNGNLIVFLGDLFQILTNGIFRSPHHRVVVNQYHARLTSSYFSLPGKVKVGPADKLVDLMDGPKYKTFGWQEYKDLKAKHLLDVLDFIKI